MKIGYMNQQPRVKIDSRPYIIAGMALLVVMVGGVGTWASVAPLSGALVAPGVVTVETSRKTVQHLEGGIILELLVQEGEAVQRNDLLIRLDDTRAKTQLALIDGRLDVLMARKARLTTERDSGERIDFPEKLERRRSSPAVARILHGEAELFKARRSAYEGSVSVLEQRIEQLRDEIRGLEAQRDAKAEQIRLIALELKDLKDLFVKGYVPRPRILALERETQRLTGERGQHLAGIARAKNAIGETKLQIVQMKRTTHEKVVDELRNAETEYFDQAERRVVYEDQLHRVEIRAPQAGQVVGLSVHTVGAVIAPGQKLMDIVPREDQLVVEARLRPQDVDKVMQGSQAEIRFSAFDRRTTPELSGQVTTVSADRMTEQQGQDPYYAVRISVPAKEIARLGDLQLRAGMPAEVFIHTGERTALNYLMKPLTDALRRSFLDG